MFLAQLATTLLLVMLLPMLPVTLSHLLILLKRQNARLMHLVMKLSKRGAACAQSLIMHHRVGQNHINTPYILRSIVQSHRIYNLYTYIYACILLVDYLPAIPCTPLP